MGGKIGRFSKNQENALNFTGSPTWFGHGKSRNCIIAPKLSSMRLIAGMVRTRSTMSALHF